MIDLGRSALAQLTLARLREFAREKEMVFWTFVFPILMAVGLGTAFRDKGPEPVFLGVEAGPGAEALVTALQGAENAQLRVLEPEAVGDALRKGDVALVVRAAGGDVAFRYDPTRPESRVARLVAADALQRAAGRTDVRAVELEEVEDAGSRYIDFLIPGLLGLNLLSTGLWGVGFALVRMRTGKLLKRYLATPMRRSDLMLSFILARLAFLVAEVAVLLAFARVAFDVPMRGSYLLFFAVAALGAFTFSGLGLLVASRARTEEGVMGLMNLVSLPMWILSGVFFSAEKFPDLVQPVIRALPLTAVNDALRAVMIDGAGLAQTAGPVMIVLAWAALSFGTAVALFRWR